MVRDKMRAQIVFNPWESKALLAKAIIKHPLVKKALKEGIVAIGRGVTNVFVLKEMLKETGNEEFDIDINNYVAGVINGALCASETSTRSPEMLFNKGIPEIKPLAEAVDDMGSNDVIIKGGNALDSNFMAGVLVAHPKGGTIGSVYSAVISKGIPIIVPISLEKMVPFLLTEIVSKIGGQKSIDYSRGLPVGLFPIVGGEVFTEIEALKTISEVEVYPIAAGGALGGEGGTVVEIYGSEKEVKKAIKQAEEIYNTEKIKVNLMKCEKCDFGDCDKAGKE